MATMHLYSLRNKKRRERLEWLGDAVMEEVVVRLLSREAMSALEREEVGVEGLGVPKNLYPLSGRLNFAIRMAVSNANLGAVYEDQLVGLMGLLGLEEDHLGFPGGKRCRSGSIGLASLVSSSPKEKKMDKQLADLVESSIGEAFEASLHLGGRQGGPSPPGPLSFAGRHRAALVDRLISSALSTEAFISNLEPRSGATRRSDGAAAYANRFGAFDTDDDDEDEKDGGLLIDRSSELSDFSETNLSGCDEADTPGALSPDCIPRKKRGRVRANCDAKSTNEGTEEEEEEPRLEGNTSDGSACRKEESILAAREGVFRLYGAALIRFRVSVFLFCSAAAVGATNGKGHVGPNELTMRRQGAMSAENLEAVAVHLFSLENPGQTPIAPKTARHWMRVAVGRATLCGVNSNTGFSTRVAALLLSRSGERGGPPPRSSSGKLLLVPEAEVCEGERGVGRPGNKGEKTTTATAVPAAIAEAQFSRDPWPEESLPRASEQAAHMFSPEKKRPPYMGSMNRTVARCRDGGDVGLVVDPSLEDIDDDRNDHRHTTSSPPHISKKRMRVEPGGGTRSAAKVELCSLPPHYAGLVGGLPRDHRHLLARLGHQGYVKVLEGVLERFMCGANPPPAVEEKLTAAAVTRCSQIKRETTVGARRGGNVSEVLSENTNAGEGGTTATLPLESSAETLVAVQQDSDDDNAPDPWRALQAGNPHPSLSGLIEPAELAYTGPKRMVLPIPNPFYRRVFHALCRVHGFCSRGGETSRKGQATEAAGYEEAEAVRHRTVEVTRGAGSISISKGRAEQQGVGAGSKMLIPVETLLSHER